VVLLGRVVGSCGSLALRVGVYRHQCVIQQWWGVSCALVVMTWWYIVFFRGCAGLFIVVGAPSCGGGGGCGGVWLMLQCAWLRGCNHLCSRCRVPGDGGLFLCRLCTVSVD
jgi:hypothetical protein